VEAEPSKTGDREGAGHSAEYFGGYRNYWWNRDHLQLVASRWDLPDDAVVLDVGCGLGHWTSALSHALPNTVRVVGVDPEPNWVAAAARTLAPPRFEFHTAGAYELPFDEGAFDMVTCQTVLIHLADPDRALSEMKRVLRRRGLLVAAEPSNRASQFAYDSATADLPLDAQTRRGRFYLVCETGKRLLGEGDNSFGDLLPAALDHAGLEQIEVRLCDKALALLPPYATAEAEAMVKDLTDWFERGIWIWDEPTTRRYFLAAGGTADAFADEWSFIRSLQAAEQAALSSRTLTTAGGTLTYIAWGRKPDQALSTSRD
jgi:SAM-dependent methyltransferase